MRYRKPAFREAFWNDVTAAAEHYDFVRPGWGRNFKRNRES
jgi:hypothetical protein